MRRIITFLGVRPIPTDYSFQGKIYQGSVFAEALRQFVDFDQMLVCLTDEARSGAWQVLSQLNDSRIVDLTIPRAQNTQEMWAIFDIILPHIKEGDVLIFDLTHGLRSLPFLIFLFAAYLQTTRNVTIEAIYYGALELGDRQRGIPAPVIDLSEFVHMIDWLIAAERFNRVGDARQLAALLKQQQKILATDNQGNKALLNQVGRLGNLAEALTEISQSLRLIRPHQVMQQAALLDDRIEAAKPVLEQSAAARPFNLLLDAILETYKPLALQNPEESQLPLNLNVCRALIHWYAEREQWVQAVSLAREWLLSWIMLQLKIVQITQRSKRQRVEDVIGMEAGEYKEAKSKKKPFEPLFLSNLPRLEEVLSLWLSLTEVRNDIDHAGMRENPGDPKNLIRQITELINKLDQLPLD